MPDGTNVVGVTVSEPEEDVSNRCGIHWADANANCDNTRCVSQDTECPSGQSCFTGLTTPSCDQSNQDVGNNAQSDPEDPAGLPACLTALDDGHIRDAGGLAGFTSATPDCEAYQRFDPAGNYCVYDYVREVCPSCGSCAMEMSPGGNSDQSNQGGGALNEEVSLVMQVVGVTEENKQGVCDAVASGLSGECSYVSLEGPSTSGRRKLEASQVYMDIAVANAQSAAALAQDASFITSLAMPDGTNVVGVTVSEPEEDVSNRCGIHWADANANCDNTRCVSQDTECPSGQSCFTGLTTPSCDQSNQDVGNNAQSDPEDPAGLPVCLTALDD